MTETASVSETKPLRAKTRRRRASRASYELGRNPPRRALSFGCLVVALLSTSATSSVEAQETLGNVQSRSSDCNSFAGVFRSLGRFDPRLPVGAQVPGRRPGRTDSENYRFLGRDLLRCDPECMLRADSRKTSFALSYGDGVLRWATVDSPSASVLYRGEIPLQCENGVLYDESSEWVPPFQHPTQTFGKLKERSEYVINTAGWLVSYEKRSVRAAVFGVLPAFGSSTGDWMEFPPDLELQNEAARFFDGSAEELDSVSRDELLAPEVPSRQDPLRDSVAEDDPLTVGDLTLRLVAVGLHERPDGGYDATATLRALRGRETATVRLAREPVGAEIVHQPVFDRQIGLTRVVDERMSKRAYLEILPVEDGGESDSVRNAVREVFEIGWSGGGLGMVLAAKSPEVELQEGGSSATSLTLEVTRVGIGRSTVTLHRDRPGDREWVRVFDREIALEEVDPRFDPHRVVVWVRHARPDESDHGE